MAIPIAGDGRLDSQFQALDVSWLDADPVTYNLGAHVRRAERATVPSGVRLDIARAEKTTVPSAVRIDE